MRGGRRGFLRFLYTGHRSFIPVFTRRIRNFFHRYCLEKIMDLAFMFGAAALWGVTVLLVWGFQKLEKSEGGRS
jgi:hypothetical protein